MNISDHKLKRYLGDGVYASHDGYQIWLSVNNLGGLNFEHSIALESRCIDALLSYIKDAGGVHVKTFSDLPEQI